MRSSWQFALITFCFFLSGVSALIYEICWIRKASLIFGSSSFALSTILAVFFVGLAIGNMVFGRIGQKLQEPIRWYAALELALALFALISPVLFEALDGLYEHFFREASAESVVSIPVRCLLVAAVLLPPTILMGGTLPLFCRQLVTRDDRVAAQIGTLYGVNTLGAVAGALLAGFALIPAIGVFYSICLAAVINMVAASIAVSLRLKVSKSLLSDTLNRRSRAIKIRKNDSYRNTTDYSATVIAMLFFLVGFVSIGNEVVWTRFLTLLIRNSVYTYTITLAVVLLGIVIGSFVASRLFDKPWPLMRIFAVFQLASSALTLFIMTLSPSVWQNLGKGVAPFFILILLPACFTGACFPLLNRVAMKSHRHAPKTVGAMTAMNILGGVGGSLFCGFIALPDFGLHTTLYIMSAIAAFSGILAILPASGSINRGKSGQYAIAGHFRLAYLAGSVFIFTAIIVNSNIQLPQSYLGSEKLLVNFEEGYGSLLSVVRKGTTKQLQINRLWQGSDTKNHQIMAAHIPMMLHRNPQDVLVIGVGVGQTPSRFLFYDIAHLDVVDIEAKIFSFVKRNFDSAWMNDSRVRLITEDGRAYVDHTSNQYDIISVEIGQVFRPGVEAFYSVEFYEHAKRQLRDDGVIAQFVPLAFFELDQFLSIVETFRSVFPKCVLWYNTQEMLLLGTTSDRFMITPESLQRLKINAKVHQDLKYSPWGGRAHWLNRREAFLGGYISNGDQLRKMADSAPIYRDDRPALAYQVSDAQHDEHNEIAISRLLYEHLSPVSTIVTDDISASTRRRVKWFQARNLDDLIANAYLTDVIMLENKESPGSIIKRLDKALSFNPDNAIANRMMGNAQLNAGRPHGAAEFYEKSLALKSDDPIALRGLALAYGQLQKYDDALVQARAAIDIMPEDTIALNIMGLILTGQGRTQEAIHYLEKSLKLDPSNRHTEENLTLARKRLN